MKSILALIIIFGSSISFGQVKISSESQFNFRRIATFYQKNIPTEQNISENFSKLPIYKVNGEYCLSTVAKVNSSFKKEDLKNIYQEIGHTNYYLWRSKI